MKLFIHERKIMQEIPETCKGCEKLEIVSSDRGARFDFVQCTVYLDTSWVDRRGGCPIRHRAEVIKGKVRVGQQKGRKK